MKRTTAYAMIWIVSAITISVAIYVTKSAKPLWAMLFPLLISYTAKEEYQK